MLQDTLLLFAIVFFLYKPVIRVIRVKVKNLDPDNVNKKLIGVLKCYLGDSTISRFNEHAKTCFEIIQTYFGAAERKPDKTMTTCCFRCLKFLVGYILIFGFYVLALKKDV